MKFHRDQIPNHLLKYFKREMEPLILRNDCIWAKRNGMPESVTDRFSKKHEFIFFFVKQRKYYFDLDGIRTKSSYDNQRAKVLLTNIQKNSIINGRDVSGGLGDSNGYKNPGDVSDFWDIPTQPCTEKHYATFNSALIDKPIIAGCPEFVCTQCGKPREKIIKHELLPLRGKNDTFGKGKDKNYGRNDTGNLYQPRKPIVIGLTTCNCNAGFEGGIVLDPFCGTGTTLLRGLQLNRKVIGIDGSQEYCDIAERRIKEITSQTDLFKEVI